MQKNVASQKLIVFAFDATTNLPKTGDAANLTAYVSKDYGSVTVLGDTSATEMDSTNAKGYYLFDLTQAETNADTLLFSAKSSTANVVVVGAPATVFTTAPNFSLQSIDSNGRLDIIKIAGTTQTARDIGASVLLSNGTGTGQVKLASGYVAMTWADIGSPTTTVNLSGTTIKAVTDAVALPASASINITGNITGNLSGSVGSVSGNVGGSVAGSVDSVTGDIGGSVLGTVGGVATAGEQSIAETVCEYMHTFNTTYGVGDVVAGSVMANQQSFAFLLDSGTTYASAADGSVVKEIATNAGGGSAPTVAEIWQGFFTTDTGLDYDDTVSGSGVYGLLRAMVAYDADIGFSDITSGSPVDTTLRGMVRFDTGLSTGQIVSGSLFDVLLGGMVVWDTGFVDGNIQNGSPVQLTADRVLANVEPSLNNLPTLMFTTDTGLTYADAVAGSVVYETARNANIRYVNDVLVSGTGAPGDTWGPA